MTFNYVDRDDDGIRVVAGEKEWKAFAGLVAAPKDGAKAVSQTRTESDWKAVTE